MPRAVYTLAFPKGKRYSYFITTFPTLAKMVAWSLDKEFNPYTLKYLGGESGVKTPQSHPYSYDPFTIWKNRVKSTSAVYSDRLLSWDRKKHNELCKRHFQNQGHDWSHRDPVRIERFLRDYFNSPVLVLCEVIQGCNLSNGYPYWAFLYTSPALEE